MTTLHGRLDLPEHQPVFDTFSSVPVVSISNSQRRPLPQANWVRTVHHGLPARLLGAEAGQAAYFAFLGRIAPEKGIDRAIRIARHCGVPLKVAAKVDKVDQDYFDEQIEPMIKSANVEFIGEINDKEKSDFLSGAIVLLVPIDWPEPFGLVMIEAMACGTPVIAFNRGSVPEIIDDGLTGFVVEDDQRRHRRRRPARPSCPAKKSAAVSRSASPRAAWRRIILPSTAACRTPSRRICGWSPTTRRRCRTLTPSVRTELRALSLRFLHRPRFRHQKPQRRQADKRDRRQGREGRMGCRNGR